MNQTDRNEILVNTQTMLATAADQLERLEDYAGLVTTLRQFAFALHHAADPHCCCNDCLDLHEAETLNGQAGCNCDACQTGEGH
jgi:hypothetical protein